MQHWQTLIRLALLGTERQPEGLVADGALGAVLAHIYPTGRQLGSLDRAAALLDAAAVLSLYRRSGYAPPPVPRHLPPACPPESCPILPSRAAWHVQRMLSDRSKRQVLPEWLRTVTAAGKCVPAAVLPLLLDLGWQDAGLRRDILGVIGQRGRWLAGFNDTWGYAAPGSMASADDIPGAASAAPASGWETATHASRVLYLERLRHLQPGRARDLIAAAWPTERAPQRAALLASLRINLQADDEPFLERCLDDRSKAVRRQAAEILAGLSGSRLCDRMRVRLIPLLAYEPKTSRLFIRRQRLDITLPERCDAALQRDGIVENAPAGKGQKAWWLEQMIAVVPPAVWTQLWGVGASELVQAGRHSDDPHLLLAAWARATIRHRDPVWSEALLNVLPAYDRQLWPLIPLPRRETLFTRQLMMARGFERRCQLLEYLAAFEAPWGASLTTTVAETVHNLMRRAPTAQVGRLHSILQLCALRMAPSALATVEHLWRESLPDAVCSPQVDAALDLLRFRHEMLQTIEFDQEGEAHGDPQR